MNIKIIAEGSSQHDYHRKKWGLSVLIDDDVLFDTFCSAEYLKSNFSKYHVDIKKIRHIVISHEHWDHTGGLWWILENNQDVKVYGCQSFSAEFKSKVKSLGCEFVGAGGAVCIRQGIFTSGEIAGTYKNLPIFEQSLCIEQQKKIALLTGCSHPGILNILANLQKKTTSKFDLIVGGLHLRDKTTEEIKQIAVSLESKYKINKIAPLHCSGSTAVSYFKKNLPSSFVLVKCGDSISFDETTTSWLKRKNRPRGHF